MKRVYEMNNDSKLARLIVQTKAVCGLRITLCLLKPPENAIWAAGGDGISWCLAT